jgi:hypothetical protein
VSVEGAAIRAALVRWIPDGFRDDDGVWHDGPHRLAALAALDTLAERAAIARDLAKKVEDGSADPIDITTLYRHCVVLAEELGAGE